MCNVCSERAEPAADTSMTSSSDVLEDKEDAAAAAVADGDCDVYISIDANSDDEL